MGYTKKAVEWTGWNVDWTSNSPWNGNNFSENYKLFFYLVY